MLSAAALAGRDSDDRGMDPSTSGSLLTAPDGTTHYVISFDEAAADTVRNALEFRIQGGSKTLTMGSASATYTTSNNPFSVINLEYAHSAGLTGANQLIAILDNDFRVTHQELAGKSISSYGFLPDTIVNHGTGIAAIAAGKKDGVGMMGVAPDADLHLSALLGTPSDLGLSTVDAYEKGAVVQNNSWGFVDTITRETITVAQANAAAGATLSDKLAAVAGYTSADWSNYIAALERFASTGVIVFAVTNEQSDTSAGFMAGLPSLQTSLQESWIAVGNTIAEYANGALSGATRLSAGCLETAAYCVVAEGVVNTASDANDNAYFYQVGSSFAAPQVSGTVALLSQAFPNLQPSEIVDRLLASANNSFFTRVDGSTDFGNNVTHNYNEEFGHGFLDIKAALLPIGSLGVPTTTAATGPTVPLSKVSMLSGTAHGNAVASALAGRELALFDALGTDFYTSATILAPENQSDELANRMSRFADGANQWISSNPGGFGFTSGMPGTLSPDNSVVFGWAENVGAEFGLNPAASPLFEDSSSLLGLAPDATAFGAGYRLSGGGSFGVYGFADTVDASSHIFGLGASRAFRLDGTTLTFGITGVAEKGGFLGLKLADVSTFETSTMALNAGISIPLGGLEFFATSEFGISKASDAGLMTSIEPALFSGFAVGSRWKGIWNRSDALTFSIQQPLRIERGQANLRLPAGRNKEGQVFYDNVPVDLEPEARQLDFGIDFATSLSPETDFRLGAVFSYNQDHTSGSAGGSMMAAMVHRF